MKVGIIGTGIMGSNLARCLSRRGVELALYNRTPEKAEKLAREVGGRVYYDVVSLASSCDVVVAFLPRSEDVVGVVSKLVEKPPQLEIAFINASTITPQASLEAYRLLERARVHYLEAPVYGSSDEARECRLVSIVASSREVFDRYRGVFELYSSTVHYVGEPPAAMALKLALNNIGLALPAIIAESIMILGAHGVDIEVFKKIASNLWFGQALERYLDRILNERTPRFRAELAMKDYTYISQTLRDAGLPSLVSDALANFYAIASRGGYADKDYPYAARFFIDLASKRDARNSKAASI